MCVCVDMQDFANELDGMPSITMENNIIHNNEDYGVILVKPGTGEDQRVQSCEGDGQQLSLCSML